MPCKSPVFDPPPYAGTTIPHLDFSEDDPKEVDKFKPYTAEIGPLDLEHINAMCLIEIPETLTDDPPDLNEDVNDYGSIGAFYQAVAHGAAQLKSDLRGGVKQVDYFSAFYRNAPALTVTGSGDDGFNQVSLLIDLITDQGEGDGNQAEEVKLVFQNTADDIDPASDHFDKFLSIKSSPKLPEVFNATPADRYTREQQELEAIQREQFDALRVALRALFSGENPPDFFPLMASVGSAIRNCWEHGVTPKFTKIS